MLPWVLGIGIVGLGIFHGLFAIPNFLFATECAGRMVSWSGCMEFYEGVFAVVAGCALVAAGVLVIRRSAIRASLVALAGTLPFTLFFWFAAIPTGLSDIVFGYASLPVPVAAAVAAIVTAIVARWRSPGRSEPPGRR